MKNRHKQSVNNQSILRCDNVFDTI